MNNKGFTLIEVLSVIVILSVIMGIALPVINNSLEKSKRKQEEDRKKSMLSAAEMYVTDCKFKLNIQNEYLISVSGLIRDGYLSFNDLTDDDKKRKILYNKKNGTIDFSNSGEDVVNKDGPC